MHTTHSQARPRTLTTVLLPWLACSTPCTTTQSPQHICRHQASHGDSLACLLAQQHTVRPSCHTTTVTDLSGRIIKTTTVINNHQLLRQLCWEPSAGLCLHKYDLIYWCHNIQRSANQGKISRTLQHFCLHTQVHGLWLSGGFLLSWHLQEGRR